MDEKQAGEAVFEMNVLENRLKQLDQQLGLIEQYLAENDRLMELLNDFGKESNSEIFMPLGTGIYAKGKLDKTDKVIMSLGAGIVAEEDLQSAKRILSKRRDKFIEAREELGNQVKMILQSISELDNSLKSQGHGQDQGHEHHGHDHEGHDHSHHQH